MAKFLETQAISNELMKVIKDAKEKIILISPYLKVNEQIIERLKTKSRMGTLSEIVVVYGKSELKPSELQWLKEIDDIKLYEKKNLHAKCFLNEDRAIIGSMNLYDYSQMNNLEMGVLITRDDDTEAYQELIEEINNIKVNAERKKFFDAKAEKPGVAPQSDDQVQITNHLTLEQRLKVQTLKNWRSVKSRSERTSESVILSDDEIKSIAAQSEINKNGLFELLPKKKAIQFAAEILGELAESERYTIGKVITTWYQTDENRYDRVKLKIMSSGEEIWFDTTQELPMKDRFVAAKLNNTWFNQYFYI